MPSRGRLPWLQDTAQARAAAEWGSRRDDLVVVDRDNRVVTRVNLAQMTLDLAANRDQVKALLRDAARR
jgi:hypothetical protein